jgi:putative transposase
VERRIAPSVRLEEAIEVLLQRGGERDPLSALGRLGAQLVLQRAVEDEVTACLRRARYQRTAGARGSRNGVRRRRVHTAEGELDLFVPQLRNTVERFVSQVIPDSRIQIRTRPLEALIIGAYVRGLSDRDVESLAQEAGLGKISKSTVSRVCQDLRARYQAFRRRPLAAVPLLALFLDAVYVRTRPSGVKEGVLVAWGFSAAGERVLLDLCLGQRESYEDWLELGRGLLERGLGAPRLVVADGAAGLRRAIEELWPDADRQRCSVHRIRNVLAKLPKLPALHDRVRRRYWVALDEATSPADGEQRLGQLLRELAPQFPSAAACLADDLPALCIHLRYPVRLRRRFRSTNLLERSLGELRRRTKVISRFPGEMSCLSLCWAVLDLIIRGARGLGLTEEDRRQLRQLSPPTPRPTPVARSA